MIPGACRPQCEPLVSSRRLAGRVECLRYGSSCSCGRPAPGYLWRRCHREPWARLIYGRRRRRAPVTDRLYGQKPPLEASASRRHSRAPVDLLRAWSRSRWYSRRHVSQRPDASRVRLGQRSSRTPSQGRGWRVGGGFSKIMQNHSKSFQTTVKPVPISFSNWPCGVNIPVVNLHTYRPRMSESRGTSVAAR